MATHKDSRPLRPPNDYWSGLHAELPGADWSRKQLDELEKLYAGRERELVASNLPSPAWGAARLLNRLAADGWARREVRMRCPDCSEVLDSEEASQTVCPYCEEAYSQNGGVESETIYTRELESSRDVAWVVAIHGMNTHGAWQEQFSWYFATTWGRSVPVHAYKYGRVVTGVLSSVLRWCYLKRLRARLIALQEKFPGKPDGKPDVVAHSFGTWLLGHLLLGELARRPKERLRFGRVILVGCALRPDFDWRAIKEAGLVEEVLNHFGTKDKIIPLAHPMILDSGPSGCRGFDSSEVINVRADGYGHSDLFSVKKCVYNGKPFQKCKGRAGETSHLEDTYNRYWQPFLTLPGAELNDLPDRVNPTTEWRPLPWPLRGTLIPLAVLPLLLASAILVTGGLGTALWGAKDLSLTVAAWAGAGVAVLLGGGVVVKLWRGLSRSTLWRWLGLKPAA